MWRVAALLATAARAAAGSSERLEPPPLPTAFLNITIDNATRPEDFPFRSGVLDGSRSGATCAWGALSAGGELNTVAVFGTSGGTRSFNVALPRGWAAGRPRTLLIAFHGGTCLIDPGCFT
jgi:hypothetical protein